MHRWSRAVAAAIRPIALIALMTLVGVAGGLSIQPARATLLYTMTADSGFVLGSDTVMISRTFTWDTSDLVDFGTIVCTGAITLTGPAPFAGVYGGGNSYCYYSGDEKGFDLVQGGVDLGVLFTLPITQLYGVVGDGIGLFNVADVDPLRIVGLNELDLVSTNTSGCAVLGTTVYASCAAAEAAIPEPASLALFGTALAGLVAVRRRKRKAA